MIKGFLFDKDGTLIDFKTIWLPVVNDTAKMVAGLYNKESKVEELLQSIGVKEDHIEPNGVLASKTAEDIARNWYDVIKPPVFYEAFCEEIKVGFLLKTHANKESIKLLPGIREMLERLKQQGFRLGIATADTTEITEFMLTQVGVRELFEFIGTDDGITPNKPDTAHLERFCSVTGLVNTEVAVVGDSLCDMLFGKSFGAYTIGVLSGTGEWSKLQKHSDLMLFSAAELLERMEWQE